MDFNFWMVIFITFAYTNGFRIISRSEWHARPPVGTENMLIPVPFVIIHHSYIPPACNTTDECIEAMQIMQDMHQLTNKWADIGYSFGVGGDGNAYVGRGWTNVGAHAPLYNRQSIGVCVIGDFRTELPPQIQLKAVHHLIQQGINEGYIQKDFTLLGHMQAKVTECPGDRLFQEISHWHHFNSSYPVKTQINHKNILSTTTTIANDALNESLTKPNEKSGSLPSVFIRMNILTFTFATLFTLYIYNY